MQSTKQESCARSDGSAHIFLRSEQFQIVRSIRAHRRIDIETAIRIEWGGIQPTETCKCLELTMDTRRIYEVIALPQMMYAC